MSNKYYVLTPTSIDHNTNAGSHFVTYGLKHLVRIADERSAFYDINMLKHDPTAWGLVYENADALLLAGNPRLNFTEKGVYWDKDIWDHIQKAISYGIIFADLWAGAAYHFPMLPIKKMAEDIGSLKKTQFICSNESNASLCVVRDPLAFEVMKEKAEPELLHCSSWWAKDFLNILPASKKRINCITIRSMPGNEWLIPKIEALRKLLSEEKETCIVAHSYNDYQWFRRSASNKVKCECIFNPRTLLEHYSQVDKLASFRLHASIPALSLGAKVLNLSTDARSLTFDNFGVKSTPFTDLNGDLAKLKYETCTEAPDTSPFVNVFRKKVVSRISERTKMQVINTHFEHGLGDCANFAHLIALYAQHGVCFNIKCTPDKAILFKIAGADIMPHHVSHSHGWPHGNGNAKQDGKYWLCNKTGNNISRPPLPDIGDKEKLWQDLLNIKLDYSASISQSATQRIDSMLESLKGPIVLLHTKGNTSAGSKSLPDKVTSSLYEMLLDIFDGTVILLDWDNRVPRMPSYRIRHLTDDFRACSTEELLVLIDRSDLLIGIDSGPLHLSRFTKTRAVGIWTKHNPVDFVLPRPELLNLVLRSQCGSTSLASRIPFNIVEQVSGDQYDPNFIARYCRKMLSPTRYLDNENSAADVQLQHFVEDYTRGVPGNLSGYADRHRSFDVILHELKRRYHKPRIVETGTIRSEEDWAGAGYSTYLFGAYCFRSGGQLTSIDITPDNVQFAKSKTSIFGDSVNIIEGDSRKVLAGMEGKIDVLYLDSMDSDLPEHADVCLEELKIAYEFLHNKSLIAFDDTPWNKGKFTGKGAKAVPWLLDKGWQIMYAGYQVVMTQPQE